MTDTKPAKVLTRQDIDQAEDLKGEYLFIPEWNGHVFLRTLPGRDADVWKTRLMNARKGEDRYDLKEIEAALAAAAMVDPETGRRLYKPKEVDLLNEKSSAAINRIFRKVQDMNGLSDDVEAAKKELEERGKDSEQTEDGD